MTKEKKLVQLERRIAKTEKAWQSLQDSIPMYEALAPFAVGSVYHSMDQMEQRKRLLIQEKRKLEWDWE